MCVFLCWEFSYEAYAAFVKNYFSFFGFHPHSCASGTAWSPDTCGGKRTRAQCGVDSPEVLQRHGGLVEFLNELEGGIRLLALG